MNAPPVNASAASTKTMIGSSVASRRVTADGAPSPAVAPASQANSEVGSSQTRRTYTTGAKGTPPPPGSAARAANVYSPGSGATNA